MIRRLFYRGRHFATTTDGPPVTVDEIAARLRRQDRPGVNELITAAIRSFPEQLGALSV